MNKRNGFRYVFRITVGITMLVLLLAGMSSAATIIVDDSGSSNYTRIQDAINASTAGDTILVNSGTYFENVKVTKQLLIRGIDTGEGFPLVDGMRIGDVIQINADQVTMDSLNLRNGSGEGNFYFGLYISSNNNVIKNISSSNSLCGIHLNFSNGNKLISNNASNNNGFIGGGICINSSNNNTLINNTALNNVGISSRSRGAGIELFSSNGNILISNTAMNNYGSLGVGFGLYSSNGNTLDNNIASENSGAGQIGHSIGIFLDTSNDNTISNNTATNNQGEGYSGEGEGIYLISSGNNTLSNNTASNNHGIGSIWGLGEAYGINLVSSSGNTLSGNVVINNSASGESSVRHSGISLISSNSNLIYNNVFNNINNFEISDNNTWNIILTPGTNIIGGSYLGGNFWGYPNGTGFGQTCSDMDSESICDEPYVLDANNTDYLPLSLSYNPPSISFIDPTPANGANINQNFVLINTTVIGSSTAFIDWNHSLIGWWRFNNESGENPSFFRDSSSRGNNGTCSGTNCPALTSGKFGNALNFDGINDYVDAGNDTSLNIKGAITIETWINPAAAQEKCWDGVSGNYGLLSNVNAVANSKNWSWQLRYGAPGGCYLGFQFNGNPQGSRWVTVKQNLAAGQWYHIAGTFNGTEINSYLNGDLKDTNKISAIEGNNNRLLIGNDGWANVFNGKIDEVRIHNRALSPEEIKASYDAGINRLLRNFTALAGGTYNYQAYAQNTAGNVNQTETRTLSLIANQPGNSEKVSIGSTTIAPGGTVTLPITVTGITTNIAAATIRLTFDPAVVTVGSVSEGSLGTPVANINNVSGTVDISTFSLTPVTISPVTIANVVLKGVSTASVGANSPLTLTVNTLSDSNGIDRVPGASGITNGVVTIGNTMKGDVNDDGTVTVVDALFVAQYTVGSRTLTPSQLAAADVNNDGQVTIVDALFIAQYTVGLRQL